MLNIKLIILSAVFMLIASCSKNNENNDKLMTANTLHLESMAIKENIEAALQEKKATAIKAGDSICIQKLDSAGKLLEMWEEGVVEVPGFEHAHHHEAGESHEHKPAPQMTDESMLDYQKNSKEAIVELENEIRLIEPTIKLK